MRRSLIETDFDIKLTAGVTDDLSVKGGIMFSICPNPAVNKLTIDFGEPLPEDSDIRIYDLQGIVVASFKAGAGTDILTRDNLELRQGIYMIGVTGEGKGGASGKLVVKVRLHLQYFNFSLPSASADNMS